MTATILTVLSDGAPGDVDTTKQAIVDSRKKGIKVIVIYFEEGPVRYAPEQDEITGAKLKNF